MDKSLRWNTAQWFELQWWRRYFSGKSKEDYLAWKRNYWHDVLLRIKHHVKLHAHYRVADLGCGPAGIFIALPDNDVTAVDPLLAKYKEQLDFFEPADYPNVTFVDKPMEKFTAEVKFDVAFCMNAINHVQHIDKAYDSLCACVTDSARIVISIDAHNYNLFKGVFSKIPGDILHPHQYNLNEYELFLKKRGYNILQKELMKTEFFFNHYILVAGKE